MNEKDKELYECSVQGYIKMIRNKEFHSNDTLTDAFIESVSYISKYNLDQEKTMSSLEELVYAMKKEMARKIVDKQKQNGTNDLTNFETSNDQMFQLFFTDPVNILAMTMKNSDPESLKPNVGELDPNDPDYEEKRQTKEYGDKLADNISKVANELDKGAFKIGYKQFERKAKTFDALANLESRLPDGKDPIESAFNKQKPGFFEKTFNTTSEEYNNFKSAFANFKNPDHALHGDDQYLEDAAMGYLHHKFPNLKDGELPTPEQIAKLGGSGKNRADFCLKVVQSCREEREYKAKVDQVLDAVDRLDLVIPRIDKNPAQQEFQQNLANDIKAQENNNLIEEEELDNSMEAVNEKDIEASN